jgi:zinc protease
LRALSRRGAPCKIAASSLEEPAMPISRPSRWIVLAAAACALTLEAQHSSSAPAAAARAPLEVPFRQFRLDNGLNVILHRDASVPVVAVNVWYHVGSANERAGRTGFAHLFEHLMFEGSKNVAEGEFDTLLEAAGGNNNGSTSPDRTNYIIDVPANALELALFLESDRMGYLLDTMSPALVDGQRDVVKNERRQSYENRPYGLASIVLDERLWPAGHPYSWPTIGHMEDLTAASYEDVVGFFKQYYAPNNASLVVAGDIDLDATRSLVEKWFGEIPRGEDVAPVAPPAARLTRVETVTLTDRVRLPRLYLAWLTPRRFAPGDAALDVLASVLAGGKNSRLYKRLVYDTQMAQDVTAYQDSAALGSSFQIVATARPGHTAEELEAAIDEEIERLRHEPPAPREVERALNQIEASFYRGMERVGGFGGKADRLNDYFASGGGPDFFAEDLARYAPLTPSDVQAALQWLPPDRRVELVVEPEAAP